MGTELVSTRVVRIEVWSKDEARYQIDDDLQVVSGRLYFLQGNLSNDDVDRLCMELLVDPVVENYVVDFPHFITGATHSIDVTLLPGVTDPAAENLLRAAQTMGIQTLEQAATGERHLVYHSVVYPGDLQTLATTVFANPVIQRYAIDEPISPPFVQVAEADNTVEVIPIRGLTNDQLNAISQTRRLSLDLQEMIAIRDYFTSLERDPTDAELEMLAQTWSEHCVHKTFKAKITYTGPPHGQPGNARVVEQQIDGLLKTYIRSATEKVNKPWVYSAFVDNAGIVRFDDTFDLAFKVETHNRPSAIEPFGGANTGIGGVIRDVLGVSARPVANTDVLCFGPLDLPHDRLPEGTLHPERIQADVVAGIEDYGNKMGIPTVNGAVLYHPGYTANPLVFCGCLGVLPHDAHRTEVKPGDLIVVIGGRTGRDGLRGATFSSMEIDATTGQVSGGAVQIGHPIHEKQVQEVVLRARDEGLYNAITDCGAGGLSSAVGEMAEALGATVQLNQVPLKYPGLRPWEIWLSEAQERMVLSVPPEKWPRLKEICDGQDIDGVVIGMFGATGRLILHYGEKLICDISTSFLHDGIPQKQLKAIWEPANNKVRSQQSTLDMDIENTLFKLLGMPAIRSKEEVVRRYDHEVQGGTSVKPLVGVDNHGPSDASVIVPLAAIQKAGAQDRSVAQRGVAISNGICPQYGEIDPYVMAWAAVDEAVRNLVAVGADPDQVSILDNFCWGNTSLPDRLGALVRCAQGCYDAALAYDVPYISGKDSLNNEYLGDDGQRHAIPGTLLISAIGIVPDVAGAVTMDLKTPGNLLYLIGETRRELGGSHFNLLHKIDAGELPQPVPNALATMRALHQAMRDGLVAAAHDCSEGGLLVAMAEMCIAGRRGAELYVRELLNSTDSLTLTEVLFSESQARFIVEVRPDHAAAFEAHLQDSPFVNIGMVRQAASLDLVGWQDGEQLTIPVSKMEQAWRGDVPVPAVPESVRAQIPDRKRATLPQSAWGVKPSKPRVLILHANGTNRDHDAMLACELAGGEPEIVHVNQLFKRERDLLDYHMLVVPGGFSYGDDLGAGVLWSLDLRERLGGDLHRFIAEGRPVMGICNGFQTLVKAGLLPDDSGQGNHADDNQPDRVVTLTYNERARFECRWVYLQPNIHSSCLFTQGLVDPLYVPVAHGEGRIAVRNQAALDRLWSDGLVALRYVDEKGDPTGYPVNPNGSVDNIAGLCNAAGNVFGLMPHPENHVFPWQHPRYHRGERGMSGLKLFENGVKFA